MTKSSDPETGSILGVQSVVDQAMQPPGASSGGPSALEATSIVAIISMITSTIVALTGVIVPQVIAARKATVDRMLAHRTWWRDKRVEMYSEMLTFCAETLRSRVLADEQVAALEGRIGVAGSERAANMFFNFVDAARSGDYPRMKAATSELRDHVRNEVWQLSQGSGNY